VTRPDLPTIALDTPAGAPASVPAAAEATATASPPDAQRQPGSAGRWWRRLRLWLVLTLIVLSAVGLVAVFQSRTEVGALDPDAPTPEGSRALATLLRNRDVAVDQFGDVPAAMSAARAGDTTLLVPFPGLLGTRTLGQLADLPDSVRVVLVDPDDFTLEDLELGVEIDSQQPFAEARSPGCVLPEAVSAGDAEVGYTRFTAPRGAMRCYGNSLIVVPGSGAEIMLLGAADPLTNDRLDVEGNAALSLGLLSAHKRVVWLIPTAPEPQTDQRATVSDLLPPWVGSSLLLLLAAGLLAALWQSRRLGPPVAEPLPVVVRSAETVEGRSRLYRRARASTEAYEALRAGAFARLLPALGLGTEPDYRAVVEVVASRSGRPIAEVHAVLYGPPPADDAALVAAADLLDTVVQNTLDPTRVETARHRLDGEGRPQ
jgi:hypothetical protein